MRHCHVIRHVSFEGLGLLEPLLQARGFEIRMFQAGVDNLTPCETEQPDLLVVLGGPIGVYEEDEYAFIREELALLQKRMQSQQPLLGICLGAQLMAAALGSRVYASGHKEIGWGTISLTDAGRASCLRHLGEAGHAVLHWHGDTFDLPPQATLLASTELVRHQAFAIGNHALGLQFHAEVLPEHIEPWLIGHACELSLARIKPSSIREAGAQVPRNLRAAASAAFTAWLSSAGL